MLGFRGDVLQVRVTAPSERGKANEALVELLASALEVPKGCIKLLRGHTSAHKLISVDGLSLGAVRNRLMGGGGG